MLFGMTERLENRNMKKNKHGAGVRIEIKNKDFCFL